VLNSTISNKLYSMPENNNSNGTQSTESQPTSTKPPHITAITVNVKNGAQKPTKG
jgi:hypothetical protein